MELDRDLYSIQEVRNLIVRAKAAQAEYAGYDQRQVDAVVKAVAEACAAQCERLAKMAVEETGFGIWQDKVLKNILGSTMTYEYIRDMKTVGILKENHSDRNHLIEIGVPVGIIAALIPSTNPTSTVMYKSLISLKAGNAVIISPHPGAKNCIIETWKIIDNALRKAGAPEGLVQCITTPTTQATDALIRNPAIGLILATGGEAMVRAAYSSGNPALGVGPGNGPSFIERTADIQKAVRRIFDSKTFDNGTICASEQSIVTETVIRDRVIEELKKQGGYFLSEEESARVGSFIMRANGTMNPKIVGKSAAVIAGMAGITIPEGTRVLISPQKDISKTNPYAREKLCPILAFYETENWETACKLCIRLLENEGIGHTMTMHTTKLDIVRAFALKKPVMRLLVNTPGALGGVGATTGLQPALTLGCGAVGGSATSDNVGPMNLINIRRVAYGICELSDLRTRNRVPAPEQATVESSMQKKYGSWPVNGSGTENAASDPAAGTQMFTQSSTGLSAADLAKKAASQMSREDIEAITRAVIARFRNSG